MRVIIVRRLTRKEKRGTAERRTPDQQRAQLRHTFAGAGWAIDRVLEALADVDDLYTEMLGQVRSPRWLQGRVALLGDAAYCPPMAGMGTTLAGVGGYLLAEQIASHEVLRDGLDGYERIMRPWVQQVHKLPPPC